MAQSESETVLTEHHETDNLDPRTDAPARPGTPVHIAPVQLGNITVPTPVVLSPMAGVTNWPFRVICEEYGPDGLYVAEMITARALVAHNPKALRLCHFAKSEKIRSLQLYGVNPSITEQAAKIVVDGNMADHVDLNFGCPVPKVTRRGGGTGMQGYGLAALLLRDVSGFEEGLMVMVDADADLRGDGDARRLAYGDHAL